MPLFTVTMRAGRPTDEIDSLSSAIHALRTICSSAFFHSNQATSGWTRDTRRWQSRAQAKCSSLRSWCHQVRRPTENERSSKALWSTSLQPGSIPTTSWYSSWKPTVRTDRLAGASLLLPLH
jgi:hypothetical protein